jgi:hypothetical protein
MMDYINYISGISFRFIKPQTPLVPIGWAKLRNLLNLGVLLELNNTKIPYRERKMKCSLGGICYMPKMSTFAIGAMINMGVSKMPDNHVFVNIGTWYGFTFLAGIINNRQKKCIGVDNFSEFGGPREEFLKRFDKHKGCKHYFYEMNYIDYFSRVHKDPIGFYIYDGNHSYKNQLHGLQTAEPFFTKNSIILVDDINYDEVRQATVNFISKSPYKYRIILDKTTYCNYHPTFWNGIMVLQRAE